MRFERIDTPARGVYTVHDADTSASFRPSATDTDPDLLYIKMRMEQLEVAVSAMHRPGFISSAAHHERQAAIRGAQFEAVERTSLAAWWSLGRPFLARADDATAQRLADTYFAPNQGFRFHVGYVEPVCTTGYAAVAILESEAGYPFAVLGGSYSPDASEAASKALLEVTQSWAASNWLRHNEPTQAPVWDIGELRGRIAGLREAPSISENPTTAFDTQAFDTFFADKAVETQEYPEGWVAWVHADSPISGYSSELAELVRRPDESTTVFSQHNY